MKKSFLSLVIASVLLLSPFAVRADIYDQNLEARFIEVKLNEKNNLDYVCSKEAGNEFVFTPKENCGYRLEVLEENEDLYAGIYDAKFNNTIDDPFEGFIGKKNVPVYFYIASSKDIDTAEFKIVKCDVAVQGEQNISCKPGEKLELTPEIYSKGDVPFTYTWLNEADEVLSTNAVFSVKADKTTAYYCNVTFDEDIYTIPYYITVDNGLDVSIGKDGEAIEGEYNKPFTIKPVIKANDMTGIKYEWLDNNSGEDPVKIAGANGPTYTIPKLDKTYDFIFIVTDKYGNEIEKYFTVIPLLLKRADGQTEHPVIYVDYNGNCTIEADYEIVAGKVTKMYWEKEIRDENGYVDYKVVTEGTDKLELKNVTGYAYYYFNVEFDNGVIEWLGYDVKIKNDMKVELGEDIYIKKGDSVDLEAVVTGKDLTNLRYEWSVVDTSSGEDGDALLMKETSNKFRLDNIQGNRKVWVEVYDKYECHYSDFVNIIIGEKPVVTATPTATATATPTKAAEPTQAPGATATPIPNDNSDIRNFVDRIYKFVLGREPEEEGAKFWSDELYNFNRSGAEVAQGFIFSQEFIDRKTSDNDFVTILYKTFFDRDPDEEGMKYWLDQLATGNMDRATVANGFIFSQEWADTCAKYGIRSGGDKAAKVEIKPTDDTYAFVERMYTTAMKRESDKDGKEYWAKELSNFHCSGEFVGAAFFLSEEMNNMKLDDNEFLTRLYATFMDREPDSDGMTYWLGVLAQGANRSDVVFGFTRSPEFTDKCIKARILPF